MARPGITYNEVAQAANQLLGQDKNPTIEQVRLLIGSGSSTTIANHLKQWKDGQKGTSLLGAKENIPQDLIALVKGLWERVIEQAELKVKAIETTAAQRIAELEQEAQKYKTNNQRWQQLFNQWQQEKSQLLNDKVMLNEGIASLQKEQTLQASKLDSLTQQLHEKQERINELLRLHNQAQTNLEHYRESVREQRLIEQHQMEEQKQMLQQEIKSLREQGGILRDKVFSFQQQHQVLQQMHTALEQKYSLNEEEMTKTKVQLLESEKEKNMHAQASQHWQQQFQQTQQTLESRTTQCIDIQAEIKLMTQLLTDMKERNTEAQDQVKLLGQEKWVLTQEKAQLEGKLQQMQKMLRA